ncbi:ABC transporter substrate-binding protein [Pilimelia terevasa]|uniref:ABC transporter substrate-binding protein n=1 Tax=Pilimelia terevasa TaxID=53372 RepID=A0A8J3FHE7_9ACTN|nr:transporter substrate-binding domain-containing protein [Pilimelia terevasa]GGK28727.1 ABC transporter substrate-binding protein [Pilimelia terevasa]
MSRFARRIPILAGLLTGALLTGCAAKSAPADTEADPRQFLSGTVRVGVSGDEYPGWNRVINGRRFGFDIAVVEALASYFHFTPQYVEVSIPDRMNKLVAGEVQLVVSNFSMTTEREKDVDFAGPYFVDAQSFFHWTDATDLLQIPPSQICTPNGTTAADRLLQLGWRPRLEQSLSACMNKFLTSRDKKMFVSTDASILAAFARGHGMLPPKPIPIGGIEQYGVGLPNNRPKLCAEVNKALELFLANEWQTAFGTYLQDSVDIAAKRPGALRPCDPGPSPSTPTPR